MSDHPAIEWLNTCPNIGANGERHIRSMAAQIARLEAECTNLATHGRVYKRQYEQACQDHATAMAEIERLLEVVQQIARQNLAGEISDDEREFADFYGAYDYIVTYTRAALAQSSPDKPSRVGYGIAAAPTQEKLLAAMRWIDTFEPETTAAAEAKFGFKLFSWRSPVRGPQNPSFGRRPMAQAREAVSHRRGRTDDLRLGAAGCHRFLGRGQFSYRMQGEPSRFPAGQEEVASPQGVDGERPLLSVAARCDPS
jgi:hypothetical protein